MAKELDIETLQHNLHNIAFCDLEAEDLRGVDPNYAKLFRLSQLMLEYVLQSQDFLARTQQDTEAQLQTALEVPRRRRLMSAHLLYSDVKILSCATKSSRKKCTSVGVSYTHITACSTPTKSSRSL